MMDQTQQAVWQKKLQALDAYRPPQWMHLDPTKAPPDSRPFIVTSVPFPAYPAPGAAATSLLAPAFTVPVGYVAVINKLAIVHVGGGIVDGVGNIIWRVLINGGAAKGLNNLTAQVGSFQIPSDVVIVINEGDVFQITVEVPAASPPQVGTTGARIQGYLVPVLRRLS